MRGGEPVFVWKGKEYGVCFSDAGYCIAQTDGSNEELCKTPEDVLAYMVGNERLWDIITEVSVVFRAA